MDLNMKVKVTEVSAEPIETMDLLSNAWCSSAIQVFQPTVEECSMVFQEKQVVAFATDNSSPLPLQKSSRSIKVDGSDLRSSSQLKFDDLKSWIWLQKAIHPELDYDLCTRKKWFSKKIKPWKGISITKWFKEMKQKRKEEKRLQNAEVHAAVSVAGVAAALAAIAAEKKETNQQKSLKETVVASAAALVAAQCAQVAEAVGAKREQLSSAISAAITSTDTSNIITLTAAAATSLRGAATLRGRSGNRDNNKERPPTLLYDDFSLDFGRCKESLAKGDEMYVTLEDGQCRLRSVSAILNKDGKVRIRIKKINVLKAFSGVTESIIYGLQTDYLEEALQEEDGIYCIDMKTSQGRIELKTDDYVIYQKWITTINHMLMLSTTISRKELQFYRK